MMDVINRYKQWELRNSWNGLLHNCGVEVNSAYVTRDVVEMMRCRDGDVGCVETAAGFTCVPGQYWRVCTSVVHR